MDMSAAALPAISGRASEAERNHPLYNEWLKAEQFCRQKMINGQDFKNWLFQREASANRDMWAQHDEYRPFMAWMRENQAGARPCQPTKDRPRGLAFPENFQFWLSGGRW